MISENEVKIKFYNRDITIIKKTFSHAEIIENKNYLYMAELDYLAFRIFYKTRWTLLHPIALTHAQQAIEKYCCFMQVFLFDKKLQKSHNINQFSFLDCIPQERKKVIEKLFADFQKYRYLEEWYTYTIQLVADVLDEFVLNFYSLLLYSGIMWTLRILDRFDIAVNKSFPSQIVSTLFIYKEDRVKDDMLESYLSAVEFENKFINNFNEIFDLYRTRLMKS